MTDDTIHFEEAGMSYVNGEWIPDPPHVTAPLLTAEEARLLLDHLDHVQAASLLGDRWTVWCAAKGKLVAIEYDGTRDA